MPNPVRCSVGLLDRAPAGQLVGGVVGSRSRRLDELERVWLVVAGQISSVRSLLANREAELDRPPAGGAGEVLDAQADVVNATQRNHRDIESARDEPGPVRHSRGALGTLDTISEREWAVKPLLWVKGEWR